MSKLIYAASLSAFKTAYPDYAEPTSVVYRSVGYTGDGYIYTHGKLMKANVTSDPDNPYGLDFTLNSQRLTVSVAGMSKSVTLPIIGVSGEDVLSATATNGIATVKHALGNASWTGNQIIGPAADNSDSIIIPQATFDKYGHYKSVTNRTATLNKVKQTINADANTKYLLFGSSTTTTTGETQFSTTIKAVASTGALYATVLYENNAKLVDTYAIKNHASTATTYGLGTSANYGHVKLSDSTTTNTDTTGGVAATPKAVKTALDGAKTYADGLFASNDALIFAGTINAATGVIVTVNSTLATKHSITANTTKITDLTSYSAGWTFKVATGGNMTGIGVLEVGDMIVATSDCVTSYKATDWSAIQVNINGAVTAANTLTTDQLVVGGDNKAVKTLAAGANGQVLKIVSGKPTWSTDNTTREIKVDGTSFLGANTSTAVDFIGGKSIGLVTDAATGKITINSSALTSADLFALNIQNGGTTTGSYNPTTSAMNLNFTGGLSASLATGTITVQHTNSISSLTTAKLGKISYDTNGHITGFTEVTSLKNPNALTFGVGSTVDTYDGSAAKTLKFAAGSGTDCSLALGYSAGTVTITPSITHRYRPIAFKATSGTSAATEILSNSSNGQLILSAGSNVSIERIGSTGELKINSSFTNSWRNVTAFKLSSASSGQVLSTTVGTADLDFGDEFIWDDRETANGGRLHLGWAEVDESGKITYTI